DVTHLAPRQQRMWRFLHRLAIPSRDAPGARHAVEFVGGDILGGEDCRDAGARQRLGLFDRHDFRMGMGRTQEHGVKLLRSHDVMDIAPATGEEAPIFPAAKRYPDPIFGHCDLSSSPASAGAYTVYRLCPWGHFSGPSLIGVFPSLFGRIRPLR